MPVLPERSGGDDCASDLSLDRLVAGELDEVAAARLRAHAEGCARCRERLHGIERERDVFVRDAKSVPKPPPTSRGPSAFVLAGGLGVALAAAAAIVLVAKSGIVSSVLPDAGALIAPQPEPPRDTVRPKGDVAIGFFRQRDGVVTPGGEGDVVRPGDALRFTYSVDREQYLAIVSVDGAGIVSVYFPEGETAQRVAAAHDEALPLATELDATLGPEHVRAFFCDEAYPPGLLAARVEADPEAPNVPADCAVAELAFEKRAIE